MSLFNSLRRFKEPLAGDPADEAAQRRQRGSRTPAVLR